MAVVADERAPAPYPDTLAGRDRSATVETKGSESGCDGLCYAPFVTSNAGMPRFVGDDRVELVDALVTQFDEVVKARTPRWVSIEAGAGWGKTRLAHELYLRLAADRQDDGLYWPASILDGISDTSTVASRRKRTHPTRVDPERNSTPAWFWWGIGCDTRYGAPLQALANDLAQFELHKPGIEARWKTSATYRAQVARAAKRDGGKVAETGVSEALALAGLAVPGLGFLALAGRWSANAIRKRLQASAMVVEVEATTGSSLIEEAAPGITQVARTVLPVVILVEDVHHADKSLVEVLARVLAANDTPVLVLTTSWPGLLTEPDRACSGLLARVPRDRLKRWTSTAGGDRLLTELSTADTYRLTEDLAIDLPKLVREALADRYHNPLALQLACESPKLREVAARGGSLLDAAKRLPREVKAFYRDGWDALPPPLQHTCMLAALSSAAGVSPDLGGGDDRWDVDLVGSGIGAVAWLHDQIGSLEEVLGISEDAYAWIRTAAEWLRQFHEPAQLDVARQEALDHWTNPAVDLADFYDALFERVELDGHDPDRTLVHARLIVVAEAEAFITRSETWLAAVLVLCRHLNGQPDHVSQREVVILAASAIEFTADKTTPAALDLRELHASALADTGRVDDALAAYQELLADQLRVLGPDAPDTLTTRNNIAALLGKAGRVDDALAAFQELLAQLRLTSYPRIDPLKVLESMVRVARPLADDQLLALLDEVIETWGAAHGEQHPVMIRALQHRDRH